MTERRVELAAGVYHLQGGSNVGLIVAGGEALVIDAGLDADAAKAILRHAAELGATVRGVIITHAHADHFGGATELARRTGAGVYAAGLEGAIVGQPLLEPLYLYAGASPIQELRHKFTLAKAGVMTQPLALGSTRIAGATDASFPPMEFVDENKNIVGFDIDLMNAIAKARVSRSSTRTRPGMASLPAWKAAYDAILSSVTITDERKQKYDFSDPYINAGQAVVVRADETRHQKRQGPCRASGRRADRHHGRLRREKIQGATAQGVRHH
jgi:ABC-type amino acid transport substrate-binding protein